MKRYLLVAHRTQGSPQLLSHVASLARNEPGSEFAILVPATPKSYWHAWDEFEAQDRAMRIADRATAALRDVGANVFRSSVGSREPLLAIEDELRQGPEYDEIIICTLSPGVSH